MVARRINIITAPVVIGTMNAGRVRYAFFRNHPAKMIARTEAAAGGMLRSWLRGRLANPRFVVIVGRYQLRLYPPRFMRSWVSMKV